MSRTEIALEKLNEQQKDRLEDWCWLAVYAEEKGRREIFKRYQCSMIGYLIALEELGIITQNDFKLLRLYFMLRAEHRLEEDEQ